MIKVKDDHWRLKIIWNWTQLKFIEHFYFQTNKFIELNLLIGHYLAKVDSFINMMFIALNSANKPLHIQFELWTSIQWFEYQISKLLNFYDCFELRRRNSYFSSRYSIFKASTHITDWNSINIFIICLLYNFSIFCEKEKYKSGLKNIYRASH